MGKYQLGMALMAVLVLFNAGTAIAEKAADESVIARGRYLITTSGCNDCHTDGYMQLEGKVAESQWLLGSPVGFQGPWGTTYPSNLRIALSNLSEQQWLQKARSPMRPPMPWFSLSHMNDNDLRAIYHYVRSLKPQGDAAPAYVAPGQVVTTPYFDFVPKNLPVTAQAGK